MNELTFKMDVQLDDNENWIPAGTKVKVSENEFHLNRFPGSTPVIITDALTHYGNPIEFNPIVEWFMNSSFQELS